MYKSKTFLFALVAFSLVCALNGLPEDENNEPIESLKPRNPLLRRTNAARAGLPGSKAAATTTTTTVAPNKDIEYEDEEDLPEHDQEEEEIITTEPPKKKGIKSGVVRPFRSNDDLLAALKRRREEVKNGKPLHTANSHESSEPIKEESETKTSKVAAKTNNASSSRRRFNKTESNQPVEESPKPAARSRFASRTNQKTVAPTEDITGSESNQQISLQEKPSRTNYRRAARS